MKNDAAELEKTADFTDQVANPQASDPMLREMRVLQNKLDKTLVKFNESQQVRLTYEQIVKRLKDERIGYDNQLQALERALRAKDQDMQELVLLMHEAQHAKASAKQELDRVDQQLQEDRKLRDREIAERKAQVRSVQQMTRQIIEREHARLEALQRQAEQRNTSPERAPRASLADGRRTSITSTVESQDVFVEAYERIRDATGIGSVNELVVKFHSQKETEAHFQALNKQAQARIEELNGQIADLKANMEQMKYAGGAYGLSRSVVDDAETRLREREEALELAKRTSDRLAKQTLMMRVGVAHLAEIVGQVRAGDGNIDVTDETLAPALQQCEARLAKALEACPSGDEFGAAVEDARSAKRDVPRGTTNVLASVYEHDGISDAGSDDDENENDGSVLDRRQLKKGHLSSKMSAHKEQHDMGASRSRRGSQAPPSRKSQRG